MLRRTPHSTVAANIYSVGGNTGTVDSFVGLDTSNNTGGILNAATLLESNILLCLALTVISTFAPNSLSPLFAALSLPLNTLLDAINVPLLSLACPAYSDLEMDEKPLEEALLGTFPGAKQAGSAL
jgi:hypothetical protein